MIASCCQTRRPIQRSRDKRVQEIHNPAGSRDLRHQTGRKVLVLLPLVNPLQNQQATSLYRICLGLTRSARKMRERGIDSQQGNHNGISVQVVSLHPNYSKAEVSTRLRNFAIVNYQNRFRRHFLTNRLCRGGKVAPLPRQFLIVGPAASATDQGSLLIRSARSAERLEHLPAAHGVPKSVAAAGEFPNVCCCKELRS